MGERGVEIYQLARHDDEARHIFIVLPSRSGWSGLRRMLLRHCRAQCEKLSARTDRSDSAGWLSSYYGSIHGKNVLAWAPDDRPAMIFRLGKKCALRFFPAVAGSRLHACRSPARCARNMPCRGAGTRESPRRAGLDVMGVQTEVSGTC